MNPRLVAIAGPLKGMAFPLAEGDVSIGRESSNRVFLSDLLVSRRHCLIKAEAEQFTLSDLNSLNGTFVNDLPIKERALVHGDRVKIGDSVFVFLVGETEEAPLQDVVQLDEGEMIRGSTIRLRTEDSLYLRLENVLRELPPTARLTTDLNALFKISRLIGSIRDGEELQRKLLELVADVVPADRGALLLANKSLDEIASVVAWSRLGESNRLFRVSRTMVNQVLQQGIAILSNDVSVEESFAEVESLIGAQTTSFLLVPLIAFERTLGVIYLDTSDPAVRFDEGHLQFMTAVASVAAIALENARHLEWVENENRRLREEINIEHSMVGESRAMQQVYQFIAKIAASDATVLICGESGTGKELVARAIHQNSPRADKPFVAINCAAITETLLESELFGHERGSFTGAIAQKKGKLEIADGGTVFLDEVGELAPLLQAKLLRALQEHEFERVGGTRPIKVDIRVIAATNKDLERAVTAGQFRQDLYYRLNVLSLRMPPLRERREDIPLLANYFLTKYSGKFKRRLMGFSSEARAYLMSYEWPGNVRELENAIEHAVVLGSTEIILPEDLPEAVLETEPPASLSLPQYHDAVNEAKKQVILKAVEQAKGNYTDAARLLGVHPNYLHRLVRRLNLKASLKK